ncbi:PKD domain-containing protein [Sulfurovum sp.]|jgi:YD repeat-containing protein|uniref:PKD domain-containing protein n=1 Tax=Sulfurovum sp. TaxID=1969726 RepID=UPI002A35C5A2|nr:PKD domain-containing protein [Sulfurovum sp.]MDY0402585.1 PKD domain-containing protein [Sulfurovum sp.]
MRAVYSLIIALGLLLSGCADAGKDQSVESGATVLLDGSGSTPDADGEIKQYQWDQIEGQQAALSDNKSVKPTFTAPIVTEEETLVFRLTTIEQGGYVSPWETSDTVSITVKPSSSGNTPPTAIAEVNLTNVKYGESVMFSAAGSTDSDGEIVSYEWRDENNDTLSVEAEFVHTFATAGVHVITLIVTDDGGMSATESVSVTVREFQKPVAVIYASTDIVLVDENVTFDANGSNDVDGEIVSYRWLDNTNTVLSYEKSFTHTFSTKGEHNITLIVTDDDGQEGVAKASIMAEALLLSISLEADITSLEVNETATLTATGHYNDNTTENVSSNVEWVIDDNSIVSIDTNGILTALKSGSTTIKAKIGNLESDTISLEIKEPVLLESISPNPVNIRVGQTAQVAVEGHYSDGTTEAIEAGVDLIPGNYDLISVYGDGTIEGLQAGTTTLQAKIDNFFSQNIDVVVSTALDTSNFHFTHFGSQYTDQVPADATKEGYDEKRFCMVAEQIFSEDGSPLSGVMVSIHKHPEYGTTTTNSEGLYTIPAEGGLQLTMRYTKAGYMTIDRKVQAPVQEWVRTEDVTMLQEDTKVTTIDLSNSVPQAHISTPVTDERGTRSTTLVFDGARKATVTSVDGSTRVLTTFDVRATEFKTPESMPANLPKETAYTYCSDLKIDGTSDTDEITFDAPVVMYVDNFLGFEVGEIVPVGYYDRNQGRWIGSDNGAVVALLDTDNDGIVDALDSTGDGEPNDLDGDGSFSDEVAGIQNNPDHTAGKSYWRAAFTHFTPWDHNWPYGPPEDAEDPDVDDPKTDDDEPNDCQVNVSSYVTGKSRVFHEDIPVAGTDITLHYASNRVDGYQYIIDASVDTSSIPASVQGAKVTLNIAGRTYTKTPDLDELRSLTFMWDGKDTLGNHVAGKVKAKLTVSYIYPVVYLRGSTSFAQAWARVGGSATGVRGRSTIDVSTSKSILIDVFPSKSNNDQIAQGWTLSNVHNLGIDAVFKGDGSKLKKETALTNGLVAYYKFDGNTQDSSLNGNHASGHGISYVDGLTGKAAQFDGNYDYVSLNESTKTPYLGVSAWFNTTSTKSGKDNIMMLIRLRNYGYVINLNAGGPYGKVAGWVSINNTSSSYSFTSPGSYNDGEWHHVVMNYSSEGFELYMDGVLLSKQSHHTNGAIYGGGGGYSIGRDGSHSSDYYEGLVDEFRIYNRALTENEIRELYLKGQTGQTVYSFDTLDISDVTQEYGFDLAGKHLVTNSYPDKKVLESYTYDENGKLITITDQFGEVTAITRDSDGNPTEITAPNGQKTYLTVDEQGNLTEIRYEDNSRYEFTYLDGSLMDIMTDPNGNRIDHIFDENGRITEEVDGEGGSYQFLRNVTEDETFYSTVQPMGETQTSQDSTLANGDTRSLITLPTEDTITATFSKDEKTVTSQKDGVSTVTTYTADTLTHQKTLASRETTQPGGLKQTVTYNTSYDGNETHTNSKTQTITNNGKITKILTDYNSGVETLTSPTGRSATREYDIDTRLTSSLTSGTLTPTTFTYDSKGRVTTEATGTRETTYTYDDRGNVESITDPRNKITTFTYDVMDRVTGVSYPDGTTEAFSYDNNGNLLTRTVPTPADHAFTYNGVDRKTGYTSPLQKATIYTYNKSKQVTQIERPSGKTITNTYDKGRLVSTSTPEGTTEYSYLFADKVGSITHGSESFSFTYDGTLLTTIAQNGLLNHTINYTYNNDFKVTSSTYAGVTENYSYDNDGLLTDSGDYTLTRDAQNGYVTQLTDGTLTQSRSYNSYGELTELSDNTLTCQLPQRDDSGAITQKKEIINGVTATYDYTYDDMGRLIEVKKDGSVTEAYTYDNNGNRLSATVNGETTTASYTLDDQLEVYGGQYL